MQVCSRMESSTAKANRLSAAAPQLCAPASQQGCPPQAARPEGRVAPVCSQLVCAVDESRSRAVCTVLRTCSS